MTGVSGVADPELHDVLGRLSRLPGPVSEVVPLLGGLTNRNFTITAAGQRFVLRIPTPGGALLGIDRAAERHNARVAAQIGVGPRVVESVDELGALVVDFLDARTLTPADLAHPETLARVATAIRRLHQGPPFAGRFDMVAAWERYLHAVRTNGFRVPAGYLDHEPRIRQAAQALRRSSGGAAPCHNDLLAANLLDDGQRIWVVDYEYAAANDPAFDLGNLWSEAAQPSGFGVEMLDELVAAYQGRVDPVLSARAWLWGVVAQYAWTMWASIQDAAAGLDFDFWSWGTAKYDWSAALLADPLFDRSLALLAAPAPRPVPVSHQEDQ